MQAWALILFHTGRQTGSLKLNESETLKNLEKPLIKRVRGPYFKLRTGFFPFDLWPKREAPTIAILHTNTNWAKYGEYVKSD